MQGIGPKLESIQGAIRGIQEDAAEAKEQVQKARDQQGRNIWTFVIGIGCTIATVVGTHYIK